MSLKALAGVIFIGCWVWCTLTDAYSPMNYACCVKYTRKPLPINSIIGFALQSSREVCRIDAIIFLTKNKKKVCASGEDDWVKEILDRLSVKIKKMATLQLNQVKDGGRARNTTIST